MLIFYCVLCLGIILSVCIVQCNINFVVSQTEFNSSRDAHVILLNYFGIKQSQSSVQNILSQKLAGVIVKRTVVQNNY